MSRLDRMNGTGGPAPVPFGVTVDAGGFPVDRPVRHPSSAATTTSTGTDSTVDSRIESRASSSPTR